MSEVLKRVEVGMGIYIFFQEILMLPRSLGGKSLFA